MNVLTRWAVRRHQLGRDAAYLLLSGPLALLAFVILLPMTVYGIGTVIMWIGLPVLVFALVIAGGFADRARLSVARVQGADPDPRHYRRAEPGDGWWRRLVTPLKDRQRWIELLWGIIFFPVSLVAWVITVVWLGLAVGGLLSPISEVILELTLGDNHQEIAELLGLHPAILWNVVMTLTVG